MINISKVEQINTNDNLVIGVFEDEEVKCGEASDFISEFLKDNKVKKYDLAKVYTLGKLPQPVVYLIGLGKKNDYTIETFKKAIRKVNSSMGEAVTVLLETFNTGLCPNQLLQEAVLTICEYNYRFTECKSKPVEANLTVSIVTDGTIEVMENAFRLAEAICNTRDLINRPYNYLSADDLVNHAIELANEYPALTCKVYNQDEIKAMGMTSFLAVNKGSTAEAKLIYIEYKNANTDPIALVGKGIMFDTGGYSLKANMCDMKDDMGGAATVLGVVEALAANNVKANVIVVIAATDNRISGDALLPDDVITAANGKTIEIVSTDAEGRLTLADAVYFAQKQGSKEVIDVATLTGACVVALGEDIVGAFTNNQQMVDEFLKATAESFESAWQLPITDKIREKVRSSRVADLTNSTGRAFGASGAAAFIEEFIEKDTKWIHLDIAGPVFTKSPSDGKEYGATGAMVRSIYNYIEKRN